MSDTTTDIKLPSEDPILNTPLGKLISSDSTEIKKIRAIRYLKGLKSSMMKQIADLESELESLVVKRESNFDILPKMEDDLTVGDPTKINEIVSTDINLSFEIYEAKVRYDLAKDRFSKLFGDK